MPIKTYPFHADEFLDTPEVQAEYLSIAMAEGDPAFIAQAIGNIARARGMTAIAREAGVGRESLYKALRDDGNPEMGTVVKVLAAMGLRLAVVPAGAVEAAQAPPPVTVPARRRKAGTTAKGERATA